MATQTLDNFSRAYITAALWSSTVSRDNGDDCFDEPLDKYFGPEDLADETRERIAADCAAFQAANAADLAEAYSLPGYQDIFNRHRDECEGGDIAALAGHDFWLTRNGHGAGFWDRNLGEVGERLSAAAETFGTCDLYPGDDGKLYL